MTYNKSDYRSITITHQHTGEKRTFLVKYDGTEIISCAYRTATGRFQRTRVQKLCKSGRGDKMYFAFAFNSVDADGKNRPEQMYAHRLVYGAWLNDGVMPPLGQELHVDHIDEDCSNNHFNNLQLITAEENQRKGRAHRRAMRRAA